MSVAVEAQAVKLDAHSVEPIPEADKDSTGPQQMWIWAGANIAPINWILGAVGIILGLGTVETVLIVVLGNVVGCALFAFLTVMGHRTGVNQMVLSRSAFGRRGGYITAVLQFLMTLFWIGVNTYFPVKIGVAILGHFGVPDSFVTNFIVVTFVMVIQVVVGVFGFYLIRTFEKYTVPITAVIMLVMSGLAWSRPGIVNWGLTSKLAPADHLAAITLLTTAIGIGWGISWVTWASDYSRFVPRTVSSKAVWAYSYVGMVVPSAWLAALGATIASVTTTTDPARMVAAVFGPVVSILVLFAVLHGPVATNILNVYSSALAAMSFGVRLPRQVLGLIAGVIGYGVTIWFLVQPSFAGAFDNWMASMVLWMAPWAGIVLADYYFFFFIYMEFKEIYTEPSRSAYGDVNWGAVVAFVAGVVAGWLFADGLVPALQGPVAMHLLKGADVSWLVGQVVAGGLYLLIGRRYPLKAGDLTPAPVGGASGR